MFFFILDRRKRSLQPFFGFRVNILLFYCVSFLLYFLYFNLQETLWLIFSGKELIVAHFCRRR